MTAMAREPLLYPFYFFHLLLRTLGVFPEIRGLRTELLFFVFYFLLVDVQVARQGIGALHHILQLVTCDHSSYILSIISL